MIHVSVELSCDHISKPHEKLGDNQ